MVDVVWAKECLLINRQNRAVKKIFGNKKMDRCIGVMNKKLTEKLKTALI